ncbi:MAG: methyltransferase domain-containing protein [Clostridiales bacterium]|jgi:SAM-dependent methyltransferase|nr:methyltransferase domain-containing protein [Clostridiales bacterium]
MYKKHLKLFQRSNESIWTDDYIAKRLLETHLDETNEGASRTKEIRTRTIEWIDDHINKNSNIIDFGCGPGLYAYELGKLGHNVLGIDFNLESINYAKQNNTIKGLVEYKYGNYLKRDINGKYSTALMIYCDFGALIPVEQTILLEKIKNLLTYNGVFIFDVFGKEILADKKEKKYWYISDGNDFWDGKPYFLMEEIKHFTKENAIGTRYFILNQENKKIKEYILWDQYYTKDSIIKLMKNNGFTILEINNTIISSEIDEVMLIMAKKIK